MSRGLVQQPRSSPRTRARARRLPPASPASCSGRKWWRAGRVRGAPAPSESLVPSEKKTSDGRGGRGVLLVSASAELALEGGSTAAPGGGRGRAPPPGGTWEAAGPGRPGDRGRGASARLLYTVPFARPGACVCPPVPRSLAGCPAAERGRRGARSRRLDRPWPCCRGWARGPGPCGPPRSPRTRGLGVRGEPGVSAPGRPHSFQEREYLALVVLVRRIRMFPLKPLYWEILNIQQNSQVLCMESSGFSGHTGLGEFQPGHGKEPARSPRRCCAAPSPILRPSLLSFLPPYDHLAY